jgi:hypothetical protein
VRAALVAMVITGSTLRSHGGDGTPARTSLVLQGTVAPTIEIAVDEQDVGAGLRIVTVQTWQSGEGLDDQGHATKRYMVSGQGQLVAGLAGLDGVGDMTIAELPQGGSTWLASLPAR